MGAIYLYVLISNDVISGIVIARNEAIRSEQAHLQIRSV
jgi:hypothetical protein